MYVNAIRCEECGYTIFSRARHDFRSCECGKVSIDGGLDYTKINFKTKTPPEPFPLEINVTPKKLYEDWDKDINKYGLIRGGIEKENVVDILLTSKQVIIHPSKESLQKTLMVLFDHARMILEELKEYFEKEEIEK